jgi:hypothetical protein
LRPGRIVGDQRPVQKCRVSDESDGVARCSGVGIPEQGSAGQYRRSSGCSDAQPAVGAIR